MKNEYGHIASYSRLREAMKENRRAMRTAKSNACRHGTCLLKSFAPDALLNSIVQYVSPLMALYDIFIREKPK